MTNEITKQQMCLKMRSGAEMWIDDDKVEKLTEILTSEKVRFVKIGRELINTVNIDGLYLAETIEKIKRIKKGDWQCQDCQRWHPRGEECGCHGGRY